MKKIFAAALVSCAAAMTGCATPDTNVAGAEREDGNAVTGSRIPRKDKSGSEYTKVITQDGLTRAEEVNRGTVNISPRN